MADDNRVVDMNGRPINVTPEEELMIQRREEAIEQLEGIITDFRSGRMNGFAMIFTHSDGGGGSLMSSEANDIPIEYIGSLERLQYRIQRLVDFNEDGDDDYGD